MKRFRVVMTKYVTKTKTVAGRPEATATIKAVCNVVGTIPVPGVQTVCTGITEFIKIMESAHANDEQWTALLDVMQRYAKRLENFADSVSHDQPDNYLVDSTDKVAVDAREAILDFKQRITSTKDKIEARLKDGNFRKRLGASAIQGEIQECRQALADALEDFNGRVNNIIVRNTAKSATITAKPDPYDIPGTRTVRNDDFETVEDLDYPLPSNLRIVDTFWDGLVRVDLGSNKVRVAKVYSPDKKSKERFEKDMRFFSEKWGPRIARLYGYNSDSRHPYMIFALSSIQPLAEYLRQLSQKDYQNFLLTGWRLFQDLHKAGTFLCKSSRNIYKEYLTIERALADAAIGSNGQVVVAPPGEITTTQIAAFYEDYAARMIERMWSESILQRSHELHRRCLRPFTLAMMKNVKQFLEFPLDNLPSNFNASEALYKLWPRLEKRPLAVYTKSFALDTVAGDVGVLEVGTDGVAGFRRLANIGDLFAGVRFRSPRSDIDHPNICRETIWNTVDETSPYHCPMVTWTYYLWFPDLRPADVARQLKILAERHGVRTSSLALVLRIDYELRVEKCLPMRRLLQTGHPIRLYTSFSPEGRFLSAKWSFHESPPSESEAAAEADILSALKCPKMWREIFGRARYWQFEDEDLDFYLKDTGNGEEIADAVTKEESSGSTSPEP